MSERRTPPGCSPKPSTGWPTPTTWSSSTPPGLTVVVENLIELADLLLVPVEPTPLAVTNPRPAAALRRRALHQRADGCLLLVARRAQKWPSATSTPSTGRPIRSSCRPRSRTPPPSSGWAPSVSPPSSPPRRSPPAGTEPCGAGWPNGSTWCSGGQLGRFSNCLHWVVVRLQANHRRKGSTMADPCPPPKAAPALPGSRPSPGRPHRADQRCGASLTALGFNSTSSFVAGLILASALGTFQRYPTLLTLVPAAIRPPRQRHGRHGQPGSQRRSTPAPSRCRCGAAR